MGQVHPKSNGRRPLPSRTRNLNAAMADAVAAEQDWARGRAQVQEADRRVAVVPAAERIIEKLAAIERHVGMPPENGNFQGAEMRIRTSVAGEQKAEPETPWLMQTRLTHKAISALGMGLDHLEARLEIVLKPVGPTPDRVSNGSRSGAETVAVAHLPATRLQAEQAEILDRLTATLERLDGLLARIDL